MRATAIIEILWSLLREAAGLYWMIVRIVLPVMVLTRIAVELGLIEALAPLFAPLMTLVGLPPELGFAWVTCLAVGLWAGAAAAFTLLPPDALTTAQMTVFCTLMLFAHALPIEQRIIQKAGPGLVATTALRLVAALVFAAILHQIYRSTGWLGEPIDPLWVPASTDPGWAGFARAAAGSLAWMFVILLGLVALLRLMEAIGLTRRLTALLAPVLRVAGISPAATPLAMVGLLLGLAYGGGLIIREARKGHLAARDVFLTTALMALAHSLIEDTLLVVALGADLTSVLVGRVVFSIALVAVIARLVAVMPDRAFFRFLYSAKPAE